MTLGKNSQPGRHVPFADLQNLGLRTIQPDREGVLTVASVDTSYPALSSATTGVAWTFYQVARLQLPQSTPDIRVAAQLSDGTPLLVDRTVGGGHAVLFTSPLDNVANNLPVEPVWVPFLDQLTRELGGVGAAQANYKVGSYIELRSSREKGVPSKSPAPITSACSRSPNPRRPPISSSPPPASSTCAALTAARNWPRSIPTAANPISRSSRRRRSNCGKIQG